MAVTNDPTPLRSVPQQIGSAAGAAKPAEPERPAPAADGARQARAEPRVKLPSDATSLDPNAPRGTYLNLVV